MATRRSWLARLLDFAAAEYEAVGLAAVARWCRGRALVERQGS